MMTTQVPNPMENMKTMSPTEADEERARRARQNVDATNAVVQMVNRVAGTPDGRDFLEWLARYCGFPTNPVLMRRDASGINPLMETTLYNAAVLGVYLEIRRYMRPENRHAVEIEL